MSFSTCMLIYYILSRILSTVFAGVLIKKEDELLGIMIGLACLVPIVGDFLMLIAFVVWL